nr:hypothetical protein [Paraburkholderia azotifigens]
MVWPASFGFGRLILKAVGALQGLGSGFGLLSISLICITGVCGLKAWERARVLVYCDVAGLSIFLSATLVAIFVFLLFVFLLFAGGRPRIRIGACPCAGGTFFAAAKKVSKKAANTAVL